MAIDEKKLIEVEEEEEWWTKGVRFTMGVHRRYRPLTEIEKFDLGIDSSFKPEAHPPKIQVLLRRATAEIGFLTAEIDWSEYDELEKLQVDILECFNEHRDRFIVLEREDLQHTHLACKFRKRSKPKPQRDNFETEDKYYMALENWKPSQNPKVPTWGQQRRDWIGKLSQVLIHRRYPDVLPDLKRAPPGYSYKNLFGLYSHYERQIPDIRAQVAYWTAEAERYEKNGEPDKAKECRQRAEIWAKDLGNSLR